MRTRTFKLNKLVRDKIVQSTQAQGGEVNYKTLSGDELNKALVTKLIEEAEELRGSNFSASELADIKELIEQIAKNLKITDKQLSRAQEIKKTENGGFTKGHFIKSLSLPTDNKWADYYAADT